MFRRTAILAACTLGLGLGVVAWTGSPAHAEDAPAAATTDKDVDMTAMKESLAKVDASVNEPDHQRKVQKEILRMQMIHQMMMADPACKKMMDDMKANPDSTKVSDADRMEMKKEIANESAKNEEVMHMMMIHMMAKDSMMKDKDMKDKDMKEKDAAK